MLFSVTCEKLHRLKLVESCVICKFLIRESKVFAYRANDSALHRPRTCCDVDSLIVVLIALRIEKKLITCRSVDHL